MAARGFTGTIRSFNGYRMRSLDWGAFGGAVAVAGAAVFIGRGLP
jgi:hypothetical protein